MVTTHTDTAAFRYIYVLSARQKAIQYHTAQANLLNCNTVLNSPTINFFMLQYM